VLASASFALPLQEGYEQAEIQIPPTQQIQQKRRSQILYICFYLKLILNILCVIKKLRDGSYTKKKTAAVLNAIGKAQLTPE